jgi:hypothetical protein
MDISKKMIAIKTHKLFIIEIAISFQKISKEVENSSTLKEGMDFRKRKYRCRMKSFRQMFEKVILKIQRFEIDVLSFINSSLGAGPN